MTRLISIALIILLAAASVQASSFTVTHAKVDHQNRFMGSTTPTTVLDADAPGGVFSTYDGTQNNQGVVANFDAQPATFAVYGFSQLVSQVFGYAYLEPAGTINLTAAATFDASYIEGTGANVDVAYGIKQVSTGTYTYLSGINAGQPVAFPAGDYLIEFRASNAGGVGGSGFDTLSLTVTPEPTSAALSLLSMTATFGRRRGR